MKAVRMWTRVGAILNTILCVFYGILSVLAAAGTVIVWNYAGDIAEYLTNIDSESITAGYEAVASIFGELGMGIILVLVIALLVFFVAMFILSLVPAILGFKWNKRHKDGGDPLWLARPLYGNIIARLICNLLSFAIVAALAFGIGTDGNSAMFLDVAYQGVVVASHIICLAKAKHACDLFGGKITEHA